MTDSNQKEEKQPPVCEPDNITGEHPSLERRQAYIEQYNKKHGIKQADADILTPVQTPYVPPLGSSDSRER